VLTIERKEGADSMLCAGGDIDLIVSAVPTLNSSSRFEIKADHLQHANRMLNDAHPPPDVNMTEDAPIFHPILW
jgi:hypothetical protein